MIDLATLNEYTPWLSSFLKDEYLTQRNKEKAWAYSNPGYVLLGLVIEAFTNEPYHEYIQKNILPLANMVNTFPSRTQDPIFAVNHGFPLPPPIHRMAQDLLTIISDEKEPMLQQIAKKFQNHIQFAENSLKQTEIATLQDLVRNLERDLSNAKINQDLVEIKDKYREAVAKHCQSLPDNQGVISQIIKCINQVQEWLEKNEGLPNQEKSIDQARQLIGIADSIIQYLSWKEEVLGSIVTNLSLACPAGKWYSTISDLIAFHQSLWAKDGKLAPYLSHMLSQPVNSGPPDANERYGYGIFLRGEGADLRVGHTGKTCGSQATYHHFPNVGLTVITLSNDERDGFRVPENIERFLVERLNSQIVYLDHRVNPEAYDDFLRDLTSMMKSPSSNTSGNTHASLLKILSSHTEIKEQQALASHQSTPTSSEPIDSTSSKVIAEEKAVTKDAANSVEQKNLSTEADASEQSHSYKR